MIQIICENDNSKKRYPLGTSLKEILSDINISTQFPILGALVNNKARNLNFQVFKPKTIRFFDITHPIGYQMYLRSLSFVMYKAVKDLYPNAQLYIKHSISGGKYCELNNIDLTIDSTIVSTIKQRMREIINQDLPFKRAELPTNEALEVFEKHQLYDKSLLFKTRSRVYTSVYYLEDCVNYYYGYLVPSTAYLDIFHLEHYYDGILLQAPSRSNPTRCSRVIRYEKLFNIFKEHKKWVNILGVPYIGELNTFIEQKTVSNLIKVSEALHEKKMSEVADLIHDKKQIKIILVSGPSSSGKTTFSKRISVQLKVLGYDSVLLSTDDYFVDREDTPKDSNGNYDFECPEALDLDLFNKHLSELLEGKIVDMPTFDFVDGKKKYLGKKLQIQDNTLLIIEGIHALNPILTSAIDDSIKYKIFVSALTQISIDSQNPIPTTDNRLIRRMVRDYRYRGYSALDTLQRWQSVRHGEEKYIFPFQEKADIMFNSALLCELGILKLYAEPILHEVPENVPEYSEAVRLLKFLSYFKLIPEKEIPPTSILREFFGGSSFIY